MKKKHSSAIPSTSTICVGSRSKQRRLQVEQSPPPLPIGTGQRRYGFDPFRIASFLITWNTLGAFKASGRCRNGTSEALTTSGPTVTLAVRSGNLAMPRPAVDGCY